VNAKAIGDRSEFLRALGAAGARGADGHLIGRRKPRAYDGSSRSGLTDEAFQEWSSTSKRDSRRGKKKWASACSTHNEAWRNFLSFRLRHSKRLFFRGYISERRGVRVRKEPSFLNLPPTTVI